jgi:hypothetical protein
MVAIPKPPAALPKLSTQVQLHRCLSALAKKNAKAGIIPKKKAVQKVAAGAAAKVTAPAGVKKVAAKKVAPKKVNAKASTAARNKALAKQLADCRKKCPKC